MNEWWIALTQMQQFFWGIATFSTAFLLIQVAATFLGADEGGDADIDIDVDVDVDIDVDADADVDVDDGGGNFLTDYFTLRNAIAFFVGFSWTGLHCLEKEWSVGVTIASSMVVGVLFCVVVMSVLGILYKLKSSGTISLKNAVGQDAKVLIGVPENMTGQGKISLSIQGRYMDVSAVTRESEPMVRNQTVIVSGVSNGRLIVKKQ